MSEPLKPRIDFAEPLKEESTSAFKAQQTFSEAESRTFAPAAIDERPEDEGAAEAAVDAALRPKRSLWRKMVMGGLALFGASVGRARRTVDNECLANSGLGRFRRLCRRRADHWRWRGIGGHGVAAIMALAPAGA